MSWRRISDVADLRTAITPSARGSDDRPLAARIHDNCALNGREWAEIITSLPPVRTTIRKISRKGSSHGGS